MLQKVEIGSLDLNPYRECVNAETFRDLERLGIRLRGLKVGHVNAPRESVTQREAEIRNQTIC